MRTNTIIVLSWICLLLSLGFASAQYFDPEAAGTATSGADLLDVGGTETEIKFYERQSNFGDCDGLHLGPYA